LKKNQKEIGILKTDISSLLQMNEKLVKKLKTNLKPQKQFKDEMINFIEKFNSDVTELKDNIHNSKHVIQSKIKHKDDELKHIIQKTTHNINQLQMKVEKVNQNLSEMQIEEQKKLADMQKNLTLKSLSIGNRLDVNGIAFSNKMSSKEIDIGKNIHLSNEGLIFDDENAQMIVGKNGMTLGNLMKNLILFNSVMRRCGENFENCRTVPENVLKEQIGRQKEILNHLIALRHETEEILNRRER